ncbi:MAG: hypothetical protein ACOYL8_04865 [Patescibacteria group bacterium]
MYNKISSIILNSGKANGFSDVFVAQPDSLKESLAGKIFIIADIGGKKSDGLKVFDFLISSLNDNYYNDEKILLRDKIEGLKIENIFEAAISKTNKGLNEFLVIEKIKLNSSASNLTVGVIYENKLYFSSFGKNKALLIYRHGEKYELINVEANASDAHALTESGDKAVFSVPSFFSSVISGEIPSSSYFVFTSEALPEYISSKDLIGIITKLPPIVAAEQIKNILSKINSFIPFLGVIIKNTIGSDNQDIREEPEVNLSAHSSISSLNYTEQKTERMLEPAGLISFSKIFNSFGRLVKNLQAKPKLITKKVYRPDIEKNNISLAPVSNDLNSTPDMGKVKSLNIARADSFLIKEKIFFKKKPNLFGEGFKNLILNIPNFFNPKIFTGLGSNLKNWFVGLNKKNSFLLIALGAVFLIFIVSLGLTNWSKKQEAAKNNYNNLVATIEEKQNAIENYLAYSNEDGAKSALIEARSLLSYLPRESKDQIEDYTRIEEAINSRADKIQKVVKVDAPEKTNDLSGLNVSNIVFADGKIYASGAQTVYEITPNSSASNRFVIAGVNSLTNPQFDKKSLIYYWDANKIIKFDLKTSQSTLINVSSELASEANNSFKIFGGNLYVLAKSKNQIYRSALDKNTYNTKTDWLKENVDLSNASDIFIDGNVYVLNKSVEVLKLYKGQKATYSATALSPIVSSASKLIIGSKYIYVFDASSKRLAVLALVDGHLMNQYQLNSLETLKDFAIDESSKTAYFLDGEMVYKITLNQ